MSTLCGNMLNILSVKVGGTQRNHCKLNDYLELCSCSNQVKSLIRTEISISCRLVPKVSYLRGHDKWGMMKWKINQCVQSKIGSSVHHNRISIQNGQTWNHSLGDEIRCSNLEKWHHYLLNTSNTPLSSLLSNNS